MERGFGVGRGMESLRREAILREKGLGGEVLEVEGKRRGGKDVKGRGRPSRTGEGEDVGGEGDVGMDAVPGAGSGKAKRAARQRELKTMAREKAKLRRKGRELKEVEAL